MMAALIFWLFAFALLYIGIWGFDEHDDDDSDHWGHQ